MSLSDRLALAARERQGLPTVEAGPVLAPPRKPERQVRIILSANIPVAAVDPDPRADADAVCPTCGRTGELGMIDLGRGTSDWSCVACGTLWQATMPASAAQYLR